MTIDTSPLLQQKSDADAAIDEAFIAGLKAAADILRAPPDRSLPDLPPDKISEQTIGLLHDLATAIDGYALFLSTVPFARELHERVRDKVKAKVAATAKGQNDES